MGVSLYGVVEKPDGATEFVADDLLSVTYSTLNRVFAMLELPRPITDDNYSGEVSATLLAGRADYAIALLEAVRDVANACEAAGVPVTYA